MLWCQMYGHSSKTVSNARCVKCLGDPAPPHARETKTQTGRPPVSFTNHPATRLITRLSSRAPKRITPLKIKSPPPLKPPRRARAR
ncbi:hypothetical protein EVAR_83473_1 [Eumeta japonica]|uniref:Uncharacterized protein n=1 Tax=Eumeta variegata TaxID=151549 RepID=A0A4C1ZID2_EUMVA|nr:hypothetical protein EVAR_83473_1 [Eumeta japonica]